METNKVPTSTSTTVSATSATISPLFDPVALQTAYLAAAQLHTHLHLPNATTVTAPSTDSSVHTSQKPTTPLSSLGLPSLVDSDRFYSLLPTHLQSSLKQQQRNFLQQQSLAHPFSAFSPINTDLPNSATSTASSLLAQSSPTAPAVPPMPSAQHSLDLLLMQMQMATAAAAAAAGFFPGAFNVLPPVTAAAALGLLAPQFRLLQLGDPNFSPYAAASADTNGLFTGDLSNKGVEDASAIERSLLQAQINLLTNGSSSLSSTTSINERACTSGMVSDTSPSGVTSSLLQQLNPALNSFSSQNGNSTMKQQRIQMKRPYDEMSILRSLCSESCTTEQETEMIYGKRSKIGAADESGLRSLQKAIKTCNSGKSQQQQFSLQPNSKDLAEELTGNSKTEKRSAEKCPMFCPFDENSPDRHHPLNHRPPAMEARFLECMAAIALHSNIPLPIKDESVIHSTSADGVRPEENDTSDKSSTKEFITDIESENSSNAELRSIQLPDRSKSSENTSTTITTNENGNKKCWSNSAIDEELCKELENYKNSDVPVIHAFVLPAKLSDPASSPVLNEKCSEDSPCTVVPESVAVPVPVLNILLDRILQTMLDP